MCSIGGEEEDELVLGDTIEDTEERLLGYRNVEYRDGSLIVKRILTVAFTFHLYTNLFELEGLKDICDEASASVLASSSGIWTVESGRGVMEAEGEVRDEEE